MPQLNFHFAKVNLSLCTPCGAAMNEGFQCFAGSGPGETAAFTFVEAPKLHLPGQEAAYACDLYRAYRCGQSVLRVYSEQQVPFALCRYDAAARRGLVEYTAAGRKFLGSVEQLFRCIAFDAVMVSMGRLLFHASLVETPWGGVLFSGPSGVGKSTQAALWQKHRGAQQINGDRPVVYRDNGRWMASGSPYAGSSRCYVNRAVPVAGVVFLEQAAHCAAEPLSPVAAYRSALQGTVVNQWDRAYMETVTALLSDFVTALPCCRLRCTPDAAAVETLEKWLTQNAGRCVP